MLKIILKIQTLKHFPSYNETYVYSSNSFIPCDISVLTDTTAFIDSAINADHEYIYKVPFVPNTYILGCYKDRTPSSSYLVFNLK